MLRNTLFAFYVWMWTINLPAESFLSEIVARLNFPHFLFLLLLVDCKKSERNLILDMPFEFGCRKSLESPACWNLDCYLCRTGTLLQDLY